MSPCPHCHALASAEENPAVRWRCGVCGGPLVPSDGSFPRANGELASLVAAARARGIAVGWAAAAIVLFASAAMALPMVLLLWSHAHLAALMVASVAGTALALGAASAARYKARRAEARAKLDDAWRMVADELLRARGMAVTAPELARALRTGEAHAESLLSELSAEGHARVAVGDDAQLSYRFAPEADAESDDTSQSPPARRSS